MFLLLVETMNSFHYLLLFKFMFRLWAVYYLAAGRSSLLFQIKQNLNLKANGQTRKTTFNSNALKVRSPLPVVSRLVAGEAGRVAAQGPGRCSGVGGAQRPPPSPRQPGPRPVQSPGRRHGVHPQHVGGLR